MSHFQAVLVVALSSIGSACSGQVVISEVYGGGGNVNAAYNRDFVELVNRGSTPVNMNSWSVQYQSQGGSQWFVFGIINATLQPGQFFLIAGSFGGVTGQPLPTADAEGTVNMSQSQGKVVLMDSIYTLPPGCPTSGVMDRVGYGNTMTACSEGANAPSPGGSTMSISRPGPSHSDSNNNSTDFVAGPPSPMASGGIICASVSVTAQRQGDYSNVRYAPAVYDAFVNSPSLTPSDRADLTAAQDRFNICNQGCVLTAYAMVVNALWPTTVNETPATLNTLMNSVGGYSPIKRIVRWEPSSYCGVAGNLKPVVDGADINTKVFLQQFPWLRLSYHTVPTTEADVALFAQDFCNGSVWVMQVENKSHWVLAKGVRWSPGMAQVEYNVVDPGRCCSPGCTNCHDGWRSYSGDFKATSILVFSRKSGPYQRSKLVEVRSPIEILITDPLGRQVRFDSEHGLTVAGIPGVGYTTLCPVRLSDVPYTDAEVAVMSIDAPSLAILESIMDGTYTQSVIGRANGSYTVTTSWRQANGSFGSDQASGEILTGQTVAHDVPIAFGCPADFNRADGVTVADIFSYLSAWFSGDLRADYDGTPGVAVTDIFLFLSAWFAGC